MAERIEELPVGVFGDRRRAERVPVSVPCEAVTDDDFFLLSNEIAEISTSGLLLRSDGVPADVGEVVIVSFKPPRSDLWIDVRARIVRLLTGQTKGAPGYGLELEELSPFEREVLAAALRRATRPERVRAPRRRPQQRRRFVDPDAVRIRPLLAVDERAAPSPEPEPLEPNLPRLEPRVPKATFRDDGGVALARRPGWNRTPRSLWRNEERPVVATVPRRRRYVRPRPNPKLRSPEEPPAVQIVMPRPPRRPITATGDVEAPIDLPLAPLAEGPPVRLAPAISVAGAPPSVLVVRTVAAGEPPPPPAPVPDAAPAPVVAVGETSSETCVSDWTCAEP